MNFLLYEENLIFFFISVWVRGFIHLSGGGLDEGLDQLQLGEHAKPNCRHRAKSNPLHVAALGLSEAVLVYHFILCEVFSDVHFSYID